MNILVACNEKYLELAKYMLFSLNDYNGYLNVYLIHENVSDKSILEFKFFFEEHKIGNLNVIKFDSSKIELPLKNDKITGHITKEAYFRLYAPFFLPEDMERILYLDCDIICTDDISEFYNIDFEGNVLVGCLNTDLANSEYIDRLDLSEEHVYVNSGVLLFNLKEYRKFASIEKLNKFISDNARILDFQDQDVVNKMFSGRILNGSIYYNFQIGMLLYTEGGKLVHYTGPVKPWYDEYSRPILAQPYYDVLYKLGEFDKLNGIMNKHINNFKSHSKLASIIIEGDIVDEVMIQNVLLQLETRVEFIINYNEIDISLIDKYKNLDSRIEFVKKSDMNEYYNKLTGFYYMYLNIEDFTYMNNNFIREITYFIDSEQLAIVFYKDFASNDDNKIVDYGKIITVTDAIKLMDENESNGYRSLYISDFKKNRSNKYGYWK